MSFLTTSVRRSASAASSFSRNFSTTRPSQLARLTLVGRLGTDPELVDTAKGNQMIKYVVGTSYGPRENRQTSWFRVTSFAQEGPARDYLMGLSKGSLVYLEGDASMRTYEDSTGKTQSSLNLVQTKIEVLKRSNQNAEGETAQTN